MGAAAVVAAACSAVFAPVTGFDFVGIDDPVHFVRNAGFRGLGPEQLRWMFLEHHGSAGYDPLAWLTFGADYTLFGLDPGRFHATSLALYALCIFAFHRVALRVLALGGPGERVDGRALAAATAATLVFALHPLRVESVAWLSERHGTLAMLFALVSSAWYLRIRTREPAHVAARGAWGWALLFYALALLSKSTVVLLPVAFLVLDIVPLRRAAWPPTRAELHDRIVEKLPFFALAAAVGLLTIEARGRDGMWTSAAHFGLVDRLQQSALGLAYYVAKTGLPTDLSPLQLRAEWQAHVAWAYVLAALAFVLGACVAFLARRRCPEWTAALALYLILMLPVLGLLQSGPLVVADRYSLVGLAPLFVAGAVSLDRGLRSAAASRTVIALGAAVLVCVLALEITATRRQLQHWVNADALWSHVFEASRDPALMHQNRGALRMQDGDHAGAVADFALALESRPEDPGLLNMAGQNAAALGEWETALGLLGRLIEMQPGADGAYRARARVRLRVGDAPGAAADLEAYLRLHPEDADARAELDAIRRGRPQRRSAPGSGP